MNSIPPFFSADPMPGSPKLPGPKWQGVLVEAAPKVTLSRKNPAVLVHGFYRLTGARYPFEDESLRIFAVDDSKRLSYEALLGEEDASPVEPDPDEEPRPPRSELLDMVFSGHFNSDIRVALKLPWANAKYRVWAQMGPIKSNEISIEIVIP